MRQLAVFLAFMWLLGAACVSYGWHEGERSHVGDYSRGFRDGFYSPHQVKPSPETKVVSALLCNYAELVCKVPKK